ncbi:MAG: nucleotidyltransferase family protein [Actinobacteria bacterium]|nr:nucleotidyltransferase family protein [Actinomycetota bacterium]
MGIEDGRQRIIRIETKGNTGNRSSLHGALNVRVFGSVSRSEAGPDSDVDFLIELEPGRTLLDHAALYLELKQLLGREVDVVTEKGLRPGIRDRVLKEAIPI